MPGRLTDSEIETEGTAQHIHMRVIRERGHRWEKLDPGADNRDNETSGDIRLNTRH